METRRRPAAARTYEDFEPTSELVHEEGRDTLLISLPEFKKENIKVQVDAMGNLKISGERPLDRNKWSRFRKDAHVPDNCNLDEIHAWLDNGILHITMPKTITRVDTRDQTKTAKETPTREEYVKEQGDTRQKLPSSAIGETKMSGKSNDARPKDNLAATADKKIGGEAKESEDVDHLRQKMPPNEKAALTGIAEKQMSEKKPGIAERQMSEKKPGIAEKEMSEKSNVDRMKDSLGALIGKQVDGKAQESKDVGHVMRKKPYKESTPSDGPAKLEKAMDGMKKKQEENEPVDSGKMVDGSMENADSFKDGVGGLVLGAGLDKPKQLVVNVVVATMVVVALGIYVTSKFRSQDKA
ncbi:inactive protein RESTRICTED TEV MOVEMENT 2-like [Magnolia sinica]|uniref:inactive protein RESTRICTED TEV MOVEMENT 2-like n=1 Tax=Magnolia sinica TaxID=86752 RepID=UPI0026588FE6|nr:inactive protein RESTRICTED TEV MOVEMENT 2-like [Magnolia sinica]